MTAGATIPQPRAEAPDLAWTFWQASQSLLDDIGATMQKLAAYASQDERAVALPQEDLDRAIKDIGALGEGIKLLDHELKRRTAAARSNGGRR